MSVQCIQELSRGFLTVPLSEGVFVSGVGILPVLLVLGIRDVGTVVNEPTKATLTILCVADGIENVGVPHLIHIHGRTARHAGGDQFQEVSVLLDLEIRHLRRPTLTQLGIHQPLATVGQIDGVDLGGNLRIDFCLAHCFLPLFFLWFFGMIEFKVNSNSCQ